MEIQLIIVRHNFNTSTSRFFCFFITLKRVNFAKIHQIHDSIRSKYAG